MKAVITDYQYESVMTEREIIEGAGFTLEACQAKTQEALIAAVEDADAVITQYADINAEVIGCMKHAKMIIKYGIGVNNIDCEAASRKGIYVCNVPDYGVDEVSDHAVAMILALGKKLPVVTDAFRHGDWGYSSTFPLFRLKECSAGLIGFGRIPRMVAAKLQAFGMKVFAFDPYVNEKEASAAGVEITSLEHILETCDFVSVHCPLTSDTRHMIGEKELSKMKESAFIINTARGGVIDEGALIKALKNKWIAGAAVDVFEKEPVSPEHELLHMPNVIATPHVAWYSETAIRTLQRKVALEVVNVLSGNKPFHCVNSII